MGSGREATVPKNRALKMHDPGGTHPVATHLGLDLSIIPP
jgi:hypothetical protein